MIEVGPFALMGDWDKSEPPEGKIVLRLRPGVAFGHGWHPSTQVMLKELAARVRPGQRVLDIGTGNGILAIAAAKMGATVWATEANAEVYEEAKANIEANELESVITLELVSDETTYDAAEFDLVCMNVGRPKQGIVVANALASPILTTDTENNLVVIQ